MKKNCVLLLFLLLLYAGKLFAQRDSSGLTYHIKSLEQYTGDHPSEKVHLHLDRPWYGLGDTIWFKAYTVAGSMHAPSTISNVLYAELISAKDSVVNRHIIQLNQGIGKGDFVIPFSYKSGTYRLRAYTNYMRNDSDYFYDQRIIIGGLAREIPGSKSSQASSPINRPTQMASLKPDVQFFPEGGDLVIGLRSKVAFKAVNPDGSAANIAGAIIDQDGTELASFNTQHSGMGQFPLTPLPGKLYTAKIFCADGTGFLVDLPKAKAAGFTLSVNNIGDSLYVKVAANTQLYKNRTDTAFSLIAQSGGKYYYATSKTLTDAVFTTQIAKNRFPSGIIQFTLFSQSGEPLNERVVFVQNNDLLNLDLTSDKSSYSMDQHVKVNLQANNSESKPAQGSFSVSVTDETKVPIDEPAETTILTDLLLTSELKGYIANPNYYFADQNDKTRQDPDLLMLTQGYRRFEWKKILAGNDKTAFSPETDLSLSGIIKTPSGKPVPNAKVRLTSIKDFFAADTLTDAQGRFTFTNLNLPDTTKVVLNAKKQKGGDNINIRVNEPRYPVVNKIPSTNIIADSSFSAPFTEALERSYIAGKQLSLKNVIQLKTVTIKEHKRNPIFEPVYSDNMKFSANIHGPGNADQVILHDVIMRGGGGSLSDILVGKIDFVFWRGGLPYSTRGNRSLSGSKPMSIFVEGAKISPNMLRDINPDDVYSIEVLRSGASTAVYGSDGSSGILLITYRHGVDPFDSTRLSVDGLITYKIKGFYKAREFYSPKYTAGQPVNPADDRKTIYWNPDIITDTNGKASFEFFNAASPGTYRVVVEGIDGYGNIGRQVFRYKVE